MPITTLPAGPNMNTTPHQLVDDTIFEAWHEQIRVAVNANAAILEDVYDALGAGVLPAAPGADGTVAKAVGGAMVWEALDFAELANKPTTLVGFGITDAQPLDAELTAVA